MHLLAGVSCTANFFFDSSSFSFQHLSRLEVHQSYLKLLISREITADLSLAWRPSSGNLDLTYYRILLLPLPALIPLCNSTYIKFFEKLNLLIHFLLTSQRHPPGVVNVHDLIQKENISCSSFLFRLMRSFSTVIQLLDSLTVE